MREGARYRFTVDPFGLRHVGVLLEHGHALEKIAAVHCFDADLISRDRAMLALADVIREVKLMERFRP